jgi:hypothetical protein
VTRQPASTEELLQVLLSEQSLADLDKYFNLASPEDPPFYTGARFDTLGGGGARDDIRDIIMPTDLLAVQCLSVVIAAPVALSLLEGQLGGQMTGCLRDIPASLDLGAAGALDHVQPGSPADRAWQLLREQDDVGWVTAGKLLARKRPRLIPVWDNVVKCAYGRPDDAWRWLDSQLRNDARLMRRIGELHQQARLPAEVSRLRVLDVVIWMLHRPEHKSARCPGIRR